MRLGRSVFLDEEAHEVMIVGYVAHQVHQSQQAMQKR